MYSYKILLAFAWRWVEKSYTTVPFGNTFGLLSLVNCVSKEIVSIINISYIEAEDIQSYYDEKYIIAMSNLCSELHEDKYKKGKCLTKF